MPNWIYDWNVEWLDWWHAHPAIWTVALVVAIAATVGAQMTRKN